MKRLALFLSSCLMLQLVLPIQAQWANEVYRSYTETALNHQTDAQGSSVQNQRVRAIVQARSPRDLAVLKNSIQRFQGASLKNEYDTVFNGFSVELKESDYYKLAALKEVAKISKAKVYYPLMASSKQLTQSISASEKYHNKGEGMVISIIDSGLDVSHKDFQRLSRPELAKIKEVFPFGGENKDTVFNLKVPYGYNFADHSYRIKGYASNHGIHVSGIAGANANDEEVANHTGIDGVASEAQILSMGVFSNNEDIKGAQEDDILAAIEKSIELKADVINMSLGTANGFVNDFDPTARAIEKATEQGILVVVAAGNDAAAFSMKDDTLVQNKGGRIDYGLVSSPSTSRYALSVASFENTHLFHKAFTFNNGTEALSFGYKLDKGSFTAEALEVVYAGLGKEADYANLDVAGKLVLIKRGEITFVEKVNRAYAHQARAVMIFNNQEGTIGMVLDGTPDDFLTLSTTLDAGEALLSALNTQQPLTLTLSEQEVQAPNPLAGQMSGFTSMGSTSDLDFKPEITGVGGNVYSTDNDQGYVMMNGTSMASPHVAGATALVYNQLKKDLPGLKNYALFTKKTVMNTAKILKNAALNDLPYSVRRQGAGLIQTQAAMENRVLLSEETAEGQAAIRLRDFTGEKTFNVHVKNYGTAPLSFRVEPSTVYTTFTENDVVKEKVSSATLSTSVTEIRLEPQAEQLIPFVLNTQQVDQEYLEGFIQLTSLQEGQPNVHIPFLGFAGDWNQENMFDGLDVQENSTPTFYSETRLMSLIKDPMNFLDDGKLFDLGKPLHGADKPSMEHYAFSPNADGFADVILPKVGLLRNARELKFNILDHNKQLLRTIGVAEEARKQTLKDYVNRVQNNHLFKVYPLIEGMWDGQLYDALTGTEKVAEDGQYYLQIQGKLALDRAPQELLFPIKVDTKVPVIQVVRQGDQDYAVTDQGRVVRYTITDDSGVWNTYAKVNQQRFEATQQADGSYEVILPFTQEMGEDLILIAQDYALNESRTTVKQILGNSLQLTNWKSILSKKMSILGQDVSGSTSNADTRFIAFEFTNKKTGEVESSKDHAVRNGKITFASFYLKKQGKYTARAIEKNEQKEVLKATDLGELIYDYTVPKLKSLNAYETLTEEADQKRPLPELAKKKNYVEYVMQKNPDGSVTFTGTVSDNVFDPQELTLSIGLRSNTVAIQADGSFTYTLKNPSEHFDFINLSQPKASGGNTSGLIDSLDLAGKPQKQEKSLESTYVVSRYVESNLPKPLPAYRLILNPKILVGQANVNTEDAALTKVEKRGDQYFIKVSGFTTQSTNQVFVEGELANKNTTTDGGLYFEKEVEIQPGINAFNVRVLQDDNLLEERQVRVIFDPNAPTLELSSLSEFSTETKKVMIEDTEVDVTVLKTWLDEVEFAGLVSDDGLGYSLSINGDALVKVEHRGATGDNKREFSKKIAVDDQILVKVLVSDTLGNEKTLYYAFEKIPQPAEKVEELLDHSDDEENTNPYYDPMALVKYLIGDQTKNPELPTPPPAQPLGKKVVRPAQPKVQSNAPVVKKEEKPVVEQKNAETEKAEEKVEETKPAVKPQATEKTVQETAPVVKATEPVEVSEYHPLDGVLRVALYGMAVVLLGLLAWLFFLVKRRKSDKN